MLEIELKFRCPDHEAIARQLHNWGLTPSTTAIEVDHYFAQPDRDFAITGEAFRLRRVGERNVFTYKGPKRTDTTAKIRTEVELDLASGDEGADQALALLNGLRYRPVAIVHKKRTSYPLQRNGFDLAITLDDCKHVGTFVEIEILAEEIDRERAEQCILQVAQSLGLTENEPRSYLRMTLEYNRTNNQSEN